jgi:hypothetical protein
MAAPAEPSVALFQKPKPTVLGNLVEATHMPLGLTPHVLNSADMMTLFAGEHGAIFGLFNPHQVQRQRVYCFALSDLGGHERDGQIGGDLKCEGRATPH